MLRRWACQHLKSQELEQGCFFPICPHQHLKTLPGWESCPCQCFQTSLPLSTSSNQSGRAACQLRSLGWRCRPENMAMKCIYCIHWSFSWHNWRISQTYYILTWILLPSHLIIIADLGEEGLGGSLLSGRRLFTHHDSGPQGECKKLSEINKCRKSHTLTWSQNSERSLVPSMHNAHCWSQTSRCLRSVKAHFTDTTFKGK